MTLPPSILIRSNRSLKDATQSFHFGCLARKRSPLRGPAQSQLATVTSNFHTPCLRIPPFSCCCVKKRQKSGAENSTGLPSTAEWPYSTLTPITWLRTDQRDGLESIQSNCTR